MPLPASLFLQRGRSDSMMNLVDENATGAPSPSPTAITHSMLHAQNSGTDIELDANGAPMYTPPITMTAFDSSYGPHGLLASAMSCSDQPLFTHSTGGHSNASSYPFNPRRNLLRRTSSSSTLDSSEDEEEVSWSPYDIERLTAVYEACVEEASFETPFSGPPPSQLLHAIAKACKRAYKEDWPHSITQTRIKANQIAKEKERLENGDWAMGFSRRPSLIEATPKPPGYVAANATAAAGGLGAEGGDAEATPRRKLRRNDSMDFLPESWDLDAVARLSDKLNKSGEDDPHLYHYPHRLRTDTCSSGSDNHSAPLRSAPAHGGRLLRSMTFTSLNSLEEESSFASSSMAEVPFFHYHHQSQADGKEEGEDYSRHPLAQSDPCLQMAMPSRRPSLKPGFGLFQPQSQSHSKQQQRQQNVLYRAPSTSSLFSEAPSSIYSTPSLNSSMDTMALSSINNDESIYGSSFASTISNFSSLRNDTRRGSETSSREEVAAANLSWRSNGPFELSAAPNASTSELTGTSETPTASNDNAIAKDYFSVFGPSSMDISSTSTSLKAEPSSFTSNINVTNNKQISNKRPHPGNLASSPTKPPLLKSYTFDAISTSPTKKYMRMNEGWYPSLQTGFNGQLYPNGSGGHNGNGGANGGNQGGMMLESPFEMDFGTGKNNNPKMRH